MREKPWEKDIETMDAEDRHTDIQKVHKGFLILLRTHALFTSSCAPKVLLKTGAVKERVGGRENYRKKGGVPLKGY